ncbi:hypothetical protein C8F01DRAFT_1148181 [Mycena amicta]|nr:hypothetical protein C8F01DRAFT_1148181 [Mycena amicta]
MTNNPRVSAGNAPPAVAVNLADLQQLLGVMAASPGASLAAVLQSCSLDAQSLVDFESMVAAVMTAQDDSATAAARAATARVVNAPQADATQANNSLPAIPSMPFRFAGPWHVGALYHVVPAAPLGPASEAGIGDSDTRWYSITRGRYVGITPINDLALGAVTGATDNQMKSFSSQGAALTQFNELLTLGRVAIIV